MSLPRKRPGDILRRDSEFTRTIGKPASGRPNPFDMVGKELVEKLAAARPAEATAAPLADPGPGDPAIRSEQAEETGHAPERPDGETPQSAEAEHGPETAAAAESSDSVMAAGSVTVEPLTGRVGGADAPAEVVLTIRIPTDLVRRAEAWAAAVGLPPATLLRNSLNRFKPELMESLRIIKAGDVHLERAESVGPHMQTRVRFTPAEYADMEARLDPAGFGVLRSMLNHHARARFSDFLDRLMIGAGY